MRAPKRFRDRRALPCRGPGIAFFAPMRGLMTAGVGTHVPKGRTLTRDPEISAATIKPELTQPDGWTAKIINRRCTPMQSPIGVHLRKSTFICVEFSLYSTQAPTAEPAHHFPTLRRCGIGKGNPFTHPQTHSTDKRGLLSQRTAPADPEPRDAPRHRRHPGPAASLTPHRPTLASAGQPAQPTEACATASARHRSGSASRSRSPTDPSSGTRQPERSPRPCPPAAAPPAPPDRHWLWSFRESPSA
jgi:hypothetical protein